MLKTDANPEGLPIDAFDEIRDGVAARPLAVLPGPSAPFYGANRDGLDRLAGRARRVLADGHEVGIKGAYDCVKAFSETDLTEDLKKIDVPTLIVHGDDDQIVPIEAARGRSRPRSSRTRP